MFQTFAVTLLAALPFAPGALDTRTDPDAARVQKGPAVLLIGKWVGVASIGNMQATLTYEFRKDGLGVLDIKVMDSEGMALPFKYRILPEGRLEFMHADGRGGWLPGGIKMPFRVQEATLHLRFPEPPPFDWPGELKRVK